MTQETDYSKMTDDEFDDILETIVGGMSARAILNIGDVNAVLREELNNEVLDTWLRNQPEEVQP